MAAPTPEELKILKDFRKEISDIPGSDTFSDMYCLSWLRARDLDISRATKMLHKSLKWKKEEGIENILDWEPPPHFLKEYEYQILGNDDEGRPVIPFGVWDLRKRTTTGEAGDLVRYFDQIFAKLFIKAQESSKKTGSDVTQFVNIIDMADFSMRQLTSRTNVNVMLEIVSRVEANYPEIMASVYVINTTRVFQFLFAIIKPFLSPRTLSKIQIYTKPEQWQPVLMANIPLDILPSELGGKRVGRRASIGSTPHCDRGLTEKLCTDYIVVEVEAGNKFELELTATQPGSRIIWTFKTEKFDIGFHINFNRTEEVLPARRCEAHIKEETGNFLCERQGNYFIVFDNTHSKIQGKTVHYIVDLLEPENDTFKDTNVPPKQSNGQ